jgi:P pilus assembly chaperone PapD
MIAQVNLVLKPVKNSTKKLASHQVFLLRIKKNQVYLLKISNQKTYYHKLTNLKVTKARGKNLKCLKILAANLTHYHHLENHGNTQEEARTLYPI